MSEPRGPGAAIVERWQQSLRDLGMDSHGEFTVPIDCLGCGKRLNADGNHPAEIYAGTFNGLCYGCTKAGPYVKQVAALDGCRKVSWPPHCPSWRRDREEFYAYPGCGTCQGLGVGGRGTSVGAISYPIQCKPCLGRYCAHPLRQMDQRYRTLLRERAEGAWRRELHRLAGVPGRCSQKRARELVEAYLDAVTKADTTALQAPILERYARLVVRHEARVARLQINVWTTPRPEETSSCASPQHA
jgi:hypothetical protein